MCRENGTSSIAGLFSIVGMTATLGIAIGVTAGGTMLSVVEIIELQPYARSSVRHR
jgi:hypothetical protein